MKEKPSEEWLKAINERFQKEDLDPRQRPFRVLDAFLKEFKLKGVVFPSETADYIFNWYYAIYGKKRYETGPLFRGVYYLNSVFWPIYIPIGYGKFRINAVDCLESMPETFKKRIQVEKEEAWKYMFVWMDCLDFGYGYDDIERGSGYKGLALNLIQSGNKELQAAISLLLEDRPHPKAIEHCRTTVEIFLKAILVIKAGWDENKLKRKIGHNLANAAQEVILATNRIEIQDLKDEYSFLPDISERYQGRDWKNIDLFRGYCLAQATATAFTRMFSDRDVRPQIIPKTEKKV